MRKVALSIFILAIAVVMTATRPVYADWINLSGAENARNIAEITIEKDHVRIQLEIFVKDLMVFEKLIPADFFSKPLPGRPNLEKRQQLFADKVLQVVTDQGKKLPVTFSRVEPRRRIERLSPLVGMVNPYTGQPLPGPPKDKRVLYAELTYPFTGQPKSLTFVPPLNEKGLTKVSLAFVCSHRGVTVVDFRMLSEDSKLHLDWEDPWYSKFEKKSLQRKIGSGMRTFLYDELDRFQLAR